MKFSIAQVEHVARLARLALSTDEKKQYAQDLSEILSYVERLREINLSGVEPTIFPTAELTDLRPDVVVECAAVIQEKLVALFPKNKDRLLSVPPVFSNYKE